MELNRSEIERIVRLVIAELMRLGEGSENTSEGAKAPDSRENPGDILVLYSSSADALDRLWAPLRILEEQGFPLTHVLPLGAVGEGIEERLRREVGVPAERILRAPTEGLMEEGRYQGVVVASRNRAETAKVALAQTDSLFSHWVCQALEKGMPVLVIQDGTGQAEPPAHPGVAALRETEENHLQKWRAYGARLVSGSDLPEAVKAIVSSPSSCRDREEKNSGSERIRRLVVTAQEIEKEEGEMVVPSDAIITPLAWDVARERGVQIRREGK